MFKKIHTFFYTFLLALSFSAQAQTSPVPEIPQVPYVAPSIRILYINNNTGDDDSGDGSIDTPWSTLSHAATKLQQGDKLVVVGTGTEYNTAYVNFGEASAVSDWLVIEGENGPNGERATLTGRVTINANSNNVVLRNLYFSGSGSSGYNILVQNNANLLVFEDIEVDCQSSSNSDAGIVLLEDTRDVWFSGVTTQNCGYSGIRNFSSGILLSGYNITNIVFSNVVSRNNNSDGLGGFSAISHGHIYFENCLSEDNEGDGFDIGGQQVVIINSIARNNGGYQGTGFKVWAHDTWLVGSKAIDNDRAGVSGKPQHAGDNKLYILNSAFLRNNTSNYGGQISTHPDKPATSSGNTFEITIQDTVFYSINTGGIFIANDDTQSLVNEGNNYYFMHYDPLLTKNHTYVDALNFRNNGGTTEVATFSFSDVDSGGLWSQCGGSRCYGNGLGNIGATSAAH